MTRLNTEYCVEIRAPRKNADDKEFGSGYSLGSCWVLTARHVIFGDQIDEREPISISWWDKTEQKTKTQSRDVQRSDILWDNEEFDIALIRCEVPRDNVPEPWEVIARDRTTLQAGISCVSGGYLSNLKNTAGGQRRKTPIGQLGGYNDQACAADINGLNVKLNGDEKEAWKGFSGSPVFSSGRLIGIVTNVNAGEAGSLVMSFLDLALKATNDAGVKLEDIPGFIAPPTSRDVWERFVPRVEQWLGSNKALFDALRDERDALGADPDEEINTAEQLADLLYGASPDAFIGVLHKVLQEMIRDRHAEAIQAVEFLARVWLAIISIDRLAHGQIGSIDDYKNDPSQPCFRIKTVPPVEVDVESKMANGEKRPPVLMISGGRLRSPMDFTPSANTGLDEDGRQSVSDIKENISRKVQPGLAAFADAKETVEALALDSATGMDEDYFFSMTEEERGKFAGHHLELKKDELQGSIYIRIPVIANEDQASALNKLRKWCRQLLLVEVSMAQDTDYVIWLSSLNRIILKAQKHDPSIADQDT